ncbi:MAG: NAD(P)/FAD-dependent oxidoreductase [Lachnospiraceae bacterium]|nr:NAD(P)/FAD-dependent oxidoreductase [Lachnospiraceae bacterium]
MKVVVIGGGAAGLMAAYSASLCGDEVTILEKNEKVGKKIFITGKGRCNVTNASDADVFFNNLNRNPKFMYSAFYSFDNNAVMDFFESGGCPLKVERGNRVFPVSDHSSDIIKVLSDKVKENGVKVVLNTSVKSIETKDGAVTKVKVKGKDYLADKAILATGGASYPLTGSTGDGYEMAKALGHSVIEPKASLIPFVTDDAWIPDLMGLSLKNVELKLISGKKTLFSELGEMLFTHFGISGPLVLSASAYYQNACDKNQSVECVIDLKPALDYDTLDLRIRRDFEQAKNKIFKNSLDELLPQRLIPVIVEKSGIDPMKKVNEISKEERLKLGYVMKNLDISITGVRPINEAIITRGGINVKEIDASSMESKLVRGLFFAGEIIDVDAMTGGYNLQVAWSTGFLAGLN